MSCWDWILFISQVVYWATSTRIKMEEFFKWDRSSSENCIKQHQHISSQNHRHAYASIEKSTFHFFIAGCISLRALAVRSRAGDLYHWHPVGSSIWNWKRSNIEASIAESAPLSTQGKIFAVLLRRGWSDKVLNSTTIRCSTSDVTRLSNLASPPQQC